jgi:transcriptional regulator with GAF, ATPase, and Fis domain
LKATTQFAENIGNGKYDSQFQPLSEHDVLGNALLNMRENLARVAEEDKKRNWTTEGLAKFGEILRTNNNDVQKLSDEIISNLVKYLKANQGALYIIDDNEGEEPTMSMTACYAWDKKKYLNQKIHRGEGLAGQCWQEMDLIYLTDVPQNYIRITSGLGDANPNSILIVPLKVNDQIFGVVELASFNVLKDFEIEFVQKIAESIASTISSVKINARTQRLLEE